MNRVLYATRARRAALDFLRTAQRYVTASELLDHLRVEAPGLARSTVYRTLEMLESTGAISRRAAAEDARETSYVYCEERHHHHAICSICGHVDDIACDAIAQIRDSLARQVDFELDEHTLEFYGRCRACRAARGAPVRRSP